MAEVITDLKPVGILMAENIKGQYMNNNAESIIILVCCTSPQYNLSTYEVSS
jgi:hypothetical protein